MVDVSLLLWVSWKNCMDCRTVSPLPSVKQLAGLVEDEAVLIADSVRDHQLWYLCHDRLGSFVHEIQRLSVAWLLKGVFVGKSTTSSAVSCHVCENQIMTFLTS